MRTIWKYPLAPTAASSVILAAPRVLHVEAQNHVPTVWIEHIPDVDQNMKVTFRIVGTGQPVPSGSYAGSAMCGPFVWHVYYDVMPIITEVSA